MFFFLSNIDISKTLTLLFSFSNFQFDAYLEEAAEEYKIGRSNGFFSPMKVILIRPGGFFKLKMHMTSDNPSMQFKMPRVLRKPDMLKVLLNEQEPEMELQEQTGSTIIKE